MSDWITLFAAFGGAIVAGLIGVYAVTYSQDREQTKRQRSAALAIREDLRRIRAQLAVPGVDNVKIDPEGNPTSPQIHPWIIGLIPELASAVPEAFAQLMQLQSDLERRAMLVGHYLKAIESLAWARGELARNQSEAEETAKKGDVRVQTSAGLLPQLEIYRGEVARFQRVVPENEGAMNRERAIFSESEACVQQAIERLDHLLTTIIDRSIPPRIPGFSDPDQERSQLTEGAG